MSRLDGRNTAKSQALSKGVIQRLQDFPILIYTRLQLPMHNLIFRRQLTLSIPSLLSSLEYVLTQYSMTPSVPCLMPLFLRSSSSLG